VAFQYSRQEKKHYQLLGERMEYHRLARLTYPTNWKLAQNKGGFVVHLFYGILFVSYGMELEFVISLV
jgi:hypothetical protein